MKSLVRKLFGTRARDEGRRRPVRLGLEALEERAVPTTGIWEGGHAGDPTNAEDGLNWSGGSVPGASETVKFGDGSVTTNADCTVSSSHTWNVITESNWAGHTLTLGTGSGGVNLVESFNGDEPEHRYGTIKVTNGSRFGVGTDMKWDGGDFSADSTSGGVGVYVDATLHVCSVTGVGGSNPGTLDGITVYVGEDVYGTSQSGVMAFGGSGANWLDSNVTIKNAAEIITEQKSDGSRYGTLEFDNVGSATTKGGIRLSGSTLSIIANDGQFKRAGGDTSGNLEIDCQLWQPSGQGSAQLTSIGYNSGVYFKHESSGTDPATDFEGGACFVSAGATLKGDNPIKFVSTNVIFTSPSYSGQTDATCSSTLDAPETDVNVGCNVFTGISSWTDTTHFTHMGFGETVYVTGNMKMNDDGTSGPKFTMSVNNAQSGSSDNFNLNGTNEQMTMTSKANLTIGGYGTGTIQSGWQYTLFTYGTFSGADPDLIPGIAWFVAGTGSGAFVVQAS
jgi:hypothetical protein